MVNRPIHLQAYEFVVVSALRAQQLMEGSLPRLAGNHKAVTMAQMEVAGGSVVRMDDHRPAPNGGPERPALPSRG